MRYTLAAAIIATSVSAQAADCPKFLKTHGFLSRAQFQCGFEHYPEAYIQQARECATQMTKASLEAGLSAGIKVFDAREAEEGRKALCARVLKSFPDTFGAR